MRSALVAFITCSILVLCLMIAGIYQQEANFKDEVNMSINTSLNSAQHALMEQQTDIRSNDEYKEFFATILKQALYGKEGEFKERDVKYGVNIYGIDYEKGLLDVGVTATYNRIFGKLAGEETRKEFEVRRTIITDKEYT